MSQILVTGEAKIRDIQGPVVANSGVITALDGAASQYVRGDGTLADFPTSSGGGSSVSYYLNSSVSQGTIGGVAYRELSKEPIIGTGTDIAIAANGYVANYITDANDPDVLSIPGGNFNCEFYFSVNNNTGAPYTYAELYKYDGTTFTLLGSSVGVPEYINQGTIIAPYYFAIPVPTSALAVTDRLAIRIYVNVDGRTVTLHTENSHLCQVVTTLSKGMVSLNNLTDQSQYITTGTSGTDFNIVSSGDTHTFNLPIASATNTGKLSSTDWSTFNNKQPAGNYVTLDTTQTITAAKTFSGSVSFNSALSAPIIVNFGAALTKGNTPSVSGSSFSNIYTSLGNNNLVIADNSNTSKLQFQAASSYDYTFPAASGTLALTSDISYPVTSVFGRTGAVVAASGDYTTTQVTEGTNLYYTDARARAALSATSPIFYNSTTGVISSQAASATLQGFVTTSSQTIAGVKTFSNGIVMDNGSSGVPLEFKQYASAGYSGTGFTSLFALNNSLCINFGNPSGFIILNTTTLTSNRTFTFQNASGTLALTSDLSAYLPLSGGTLTGALSGTSATFSGLLTINVPTDNTTVGIFHAGGGTANRGLKISTFAATNDNAGVTLDAQTSTGVLAFATAGAEKMRITSGGNVGIGTSAPGNYYSTKLVVAVGGEDGITIAGSGNNFLMFADGQTGLDRYRGFIHYSHDSNFLAFGSDATERMRITSAGAVLIGTTSNPVNYQFLVNTTAYIKQYIAFGVSGDNRYIGQGDQISGAYQSYDLALVNYAASARVVITNSNAGVILNNGATSWSSFSDERLKNINGSIENAVEKLLSIRAVKYSWKTDKTNKENLGVIAQDILKVFPQVIDESKSFNEGDDTEYLSVKYTELIPVLVKAIQELEARIKQLENK